MRKRDPNRIEMGRRFREARERLNWSREVLAERADLSVSFIADLELGNTGTRLENFIRLCRLLDLNADYVLFGAPGDAVQRIMDLLRDQDEETVRVVERTVEALLRALDWVLTRETGLTVVVAENALGCVALGTGRAAENMNLFHKGHRPAGSK